MRPTKTPSLPRGGQPVIRIGTPFTPDEVEQIDDVRFNLRHESRTETIRWLLIKGLEASKNAEKAS